MMSPRIAPELHSGGGIRNAPKRAVNVRSHAWQLVVYVRPGLQTRLSKAN